MLRCRPSLYKGNRSAGPVRQVRRDFTVITGGFSVGICESPSNQYGKSRFILSAVGTEPSIQTDSARMPCSKREGTGRLGVCPGPGRKHDSR
jgi:hypothetical protein